MSSKTISPEEQERKQLLDACRFSVGDMSLAQDIGRLFCGNGLTHEQQTLLAANMIREFREALRA